MVLIIHGYEVDRTQPISTDFINFSASSDIMNFGFIFCFCLVASVYTGWNRFIFIPTLAAWSKFMCHIAYFYTWSADSTGKPRATGASVFFTYLGYYLGETFVVLYGYFFVVRLLPEHSGNWLLGRKWFMLIFWIMECGHIVARLAAIVYAMQEFNEFGTPNHIKIIIYDYTLWHFIILVAIELYTAYFLIVIFNRSRKANIRYLGGKHLPLIKHLLVSTEIRVILLAVLFLFRVAVMKAKRHNKNAQIIDDAITPVIDMFPLILVLDCVMRKALKIEVDYQAQLDQCTRSSCSCVKPDPESGAESGSTRRIASGSGSNVSGVTHEKTQMKGAEVDEVIEEASSSHSGTH